jgi:radical SAM protein with 4Fe4S-binding SPASM domain
MSVHLTSNCMYPASLRELVAAPAIGELVAHYDQERMRGGDFATELFADNVRAAMAGGVDAMIRYTLTEQSDAAEWRVVMDLAHRLSIRRINYALAFRGSEGLNAYFQCRDAVGVAGGRLENLLSALCADAADRGLRLHLSKPFPLCALTPETLRRMLGGEAIRSACSVYRDGFTRNLTINPDLSTFPCNGIALRGPKITEFSSLADAGRHYARAIEDLMLRPYHEECQRCVLWYRGFCQGVCLAEHYSTLRNEMKQRGEQS